MKAREDRVDECRGGGGLEEEKHQIYLSNQRTHTYANVLGLDFLNLVPANLGCV